MVLLIFFLNMTHSIPIYSAGQSYVAFTYTDQQNKIFGTLWELDVFKLSVLPVDRSKFLKTSSKSYF